VDIVHTTHKTKDVGGCYSFVPHIDALVKIEATGRSWTTRAGRSWGGVGVTARAWLIDLID